MPNKDIVVVGGSAGGLEALKTIASGLPEDLPASVFVVLHSAAESPGLIAEILDRAGALAVAHGTDGERIERGRIYVAPPDRHLVLEPGIVRLTYGPKENRFRPAVDPLFRSAAGVYGPRAVGVILSGGLDDGSAGLLAIKQLGGTAVVQDPSDARSPSMPASALSTVRVDHTVPAEDIAPLLVRLAATDADEQREVPAPSELEVEIRIAMGEDAIASGVQRLGKPSSYACPACHGVLLQMTEGELLRFRCHTGHAYSIESLLAEIEDAVEEALWFAVRAVDESALFMRQITRHLATNHRDEGAGRFLEKAAEVERRAAAARKALGDAFLAGHGPGSVPR
jgi:two-component system, chemotaxis family, protein-glutamate methylesterase/glutaminase